MSFGGDSLSEAISENGLPTEPVTRFRASMQRIVIEPHADGGDFPANAPAREGLRKKLVFKPTHTFDRFVIGRGNRFAHAASLAVAEMPGQAYNPLFIYGPPGVGKTHLLHAIAAFVRAHGGGLGVRCTTADAFTSDFVGALHTGSVDRFKAAYRGTDVLLIDDVQFLEAK